MSVLRTPDEQFSNLLDYDFDPHYHNIQDPDLGELRMHYLDEGPRDGPVVLCMHGEPSWCYLYRKMIPVFVAAGMRVLAPDLIGFGRSDKPTERTDYTYQRHVDWITNWFLAMQVDEVTFIGQDWGGLIGLRLLAENPDHFARFSIGNTALPTGDTPMNDAFLAWRQFSQEDPVFDIGFICNELGNGNLSEAEIDAFRAPFPGDEYKAGARQFPTLVPATPDDSRSGRQPRGLERPGGLGQARADVLLGRGPYLGRRLPDIPGPGTGHSGTTPCHPARWTLHAKYGRPALGANSSRLGLRDLAHTKRQQRSKPCRTDPPPSRIACARTR